MLDLIKRVRLEINNLVEARVSKRKERIALRVQRQRKEQETKKRELQWKLELEELNADIRKEQNKAQPKQGQQKKEKSGFDKFRDFADDFANQPSFAGELNYGGTHGKTKKNSKRSKARSRPSSFWV